jgi:hypothetical protein
MYERYRRTVRDHPDCIAMTEMVDKFHPILEYERGFFRHITPNDAATQSGHA